MMYMGSEEDGGKIPNTDILESLYAVAYGEHINADHELSDMVEHKSITELRDKEHTYELRNGRSVTGKIASVISHDYIPRISIRIKMENNGNRYLNGTLYGNTSNLGVALNGVLTITD